MGCILNHSQMILLGYAQDFGHVAGKAGIVHNHNRPCTFVDFFFNRSGADTQPIFAFNIRENNIGTGIANRVGSCHKGQRRHDHLIALAQPHRHASQMQRGSRVGYRKGMFRANKRGKLLLKRLSHPTHRKPTRT